ncbi:MAG: antitoxin [Micropruina sp.]|uniref:type II toxin-antitoxin system VapB family antitoxin n=1 Tax=Micropruina sp. TaxID=2737536 RepID=UPI0039E538A7
MPDLLIRDFPAEDLDLLDEQAKRLGLSRAEYLRRQLHATARRLDAEVTTAHLIQLAETLSDLDDEALMSRAWS